MPFPIEEKLKCGGPKYFSIKKIIIKKDLTLSKVVSWKPPDHKRSGNGLTRWRREAFVGCDSWIHMNWPLSENS